MKRLHSDAEIADIAILRKVGKTWEQIARAVNAKYSTEYTADSVRAAWRRWGSIIETNEDAAQIKLFRDIARTKRHASFLAKENKLLHEHSLNLEDVLEQLVSKLKRRRLPKAPKKSKKEEAVIIEALVSDIHVGLVTPTYSPDVAKHRLNTYAWELVRAAKEVAAEEIVVVFGGDIIQSATMHKDSPATCNMTNAEQVVTSVEALESFLAILLHAGVPIRAICVGGNHDRDTQERVVVKEGRTYLTWVIYKFLEKLFPDIPFYISEDFYAFYDIYGETYMFEHGHHLKKPSAESLSQHKAKRAEQYGMVIDGIRHGHYHYSTVWGHGDAISNGTVGSDDYFSAILGYGNPPTQVYSVYNKDGWQTSHVVRLD